MRLLKKDINIYTDEFLKITKLHILVGLDENSGLKGYMIKSIHTLEYEVDKINYILILRDVLTLRRHENELELSIENTTKVVSHSASKSKELVERLNVLSASAQSSKGVLDSIKDIAD